MATSGQEGGWIFDDYKGYLNNMLRYSPDTNDE